MHQESLLDQLRTLKQAPLERLVTTVRALADQNSYIYDEIERLVAAESDSILRATLSEDRDKVVLVVLLAAVADDIGTLPAERSRIRPLGRLSAACKLLGVRCEDVHDLLKYLPAIQPILDSRPDSGAHPA